VTTTALHDTLATMLLATIRAVKAADEALFGRRIRSAFGVVGPLATVFYQIAVLHVLGHARDIAGPEAGPPSA
jgi:hypothetical protein